MISVSESSPVSEPQRAADGPSPRLTLAQFLGRYGRAVCHDSHRCAGLIADLCDLTGRDLFLCRLALQEGIVAEWLAAPPELPRELVLDHLARKLADRLGLAPDSALWAVRAWAAALENAPDWTAESEAPRLPEFDAPAGRPAASGLPWLLWCGLVLLGGILAIGATLWSLLSFDVSSVSHWLESSAVLSVGCLAAWAALALSARRLRQLNRPDWTGLSPSRASAAVLPEVAAILLLPSAPVAASALWAGACWATWPDSSGTVFLAWLLARLFQGLVLAAFMAGWLPVMVRLMARLLAGWRSHP